MLAFLSDVPFHRCLHAGVALPDANIAIAGGCGSGGCVSWFPLVGGSLSSTSLTDCARGMKRRYGPCPASDAWVSTGMCNQQWRKSQSPCMGPRLRASMAHLPGSVGTVVVFGGDVRSGVSRVVTHDQYGCVARLGADFESGLCSGRVAMGKR